MIIEHLPTQHPSWLPDSLQTKNHDGSRSQLPNGCHVTKGVLGLRLKEGTTNLCAKLWLTMTGCVISAPKHQGSAGTRARRNATSPLCIVFMFTALNLLGLLAGAPGAFPGSGGVPCFLSVSMPVCHTPTHLRHTRMPGRG